MHYSHHSAVPSSLTSSSSSSPTAITTSSPSFSSSNPAMVSVSNFTPPFLPRSSNLVRTQSSIAPNVSIPSLTSGSNLTSYTSSSLPPPHPTFRVNQGQNQLHQYQHQQQHQHHPHHSSQLQFQSQPSLHSSQPLVSNVTNYSPVAFFPSKSIPILPAAPQQYPSISAPGAYTPFVTAPSLFASPLLPNTPIIAVPPPILAPQSPVHTQIRSTVQPTSAHSKSSSSLPNSSPHSSPPSPLSTISSTSSAPSLTLGSNPRASYPVAGVNMDMSQWSSFLVGYHQPKTGREGRPSEGERIEKEIQQVKQKMENTKKEKRNSMLTIDNNANIITSTTASTSTIKAGEDISTTETAPFLRINLSPPLQPSAVTNPMINTSNTTATNSPSSLLTSTFNRLQLASGSESVQIQEYNEFPSENVSHAYSTTPAHFTSSSSSPPPPPPPSETIYSDDREKTGGTPMQLHLQMAAFAATQTSSLSSRDSITSPLTKEAAPFIRSFSPVSATGRRSTETLAQQLERKEATSKNISTTGTAATTPTSASSQQILQQTNIEMHLEQRGGRFSSSIPSSISTSSSLLYPEHFTFSSPVSGSNSGFSSQVSTPEYQEDITEEIERVPLRMRRQGRGSKSRSRTISPIGIRAEKNKESTVTTDMRSVRAVPSSSLLSTDCLNPQCIRMIKTLINERDAVLQRCRVLEETQEKLRKLVGVGNNEDIIVRGTGELQLQETQRPSSILQGKNREAKSKLKMINSAAETRNIQRSTTEQLAPATPTENETLGHSPIYHSAEVLYQQSSSQSSKASGSAQLKSFSTEFGHSKMSKHSQLSTAQGFQQQQFHHQPQEIRKQQDSSYYQSHQQLKHRDEEQHSSSHAPHIHYTTSPTTISSQHSIPLHPTVTQSSSSHHHSKHKSGKERMSRRGVESARVSIGGEIKRPSVNVNVSHEASIGRVIDNQDIPYSRTSEQGLSPSVERGASGRTSNKSQSRHSAGAVLGGASAGSSIGYSLHYTSHNS